MLDDATILSDASHSVYALCGVQAYPLQQDASQFWAADHYPTM